MKKKTSAKSAAPKASATKPSTTKSSASKIALATKFTPAPKPTPVAKEKPREVVLPIEDVEPYQLKLEELRENLMKTVKKKKEEAIPEAEVGDEGDVAMRSLARDLVFEQTDNEHRLLDDVEAALRRIEKKVYGICEGNGERISLARLKAIPYARYCINCQSRFESI
jgi:DnaK suppressor protein